MKKICVGSDANRFECFHHGAHLSSWLCQGKEQLFLSKETIFDGKAALRGGVPVCFPQFAAFGPGQKHGFARNIEWKLLNQSDSYCEFELNDTEKTKALWPFSFNARFVIELNSSSLSMKLTVENTGDTSMSFTSALHTYFRVDDIRKIAIDGLQDLSYWNNDGSEFDKRHVQTTETLTVDAAIDRVYFDVSSPVELKEPDSTRHIENQGFNDVVVWNPWAEGAQGLKDMCDDEYKNMICIESANVQTPVTIAPGEHWQGTQFISIEADAN